MERSLRCQQGVLGSRLKAVLCPMMVALIIGASFAVTEASAVNTDNEICNVSADAALGSEDYLRAIALHRHLVAIDPKSGLAHYHLGFAYGMLGQRDRELAEYLKAADLGVRQWDLYLNLGRIYLEKFDYSAAIGALAVAEALGPRYPETHFNLGLAYERQQRYSLAEQEMLTALRLGADPASACNSLAVIYAEKGNLAEAREIWTDLAGHASTAALARVNLVMLDRLNSPAKQERSELLAPQCKE